MGAAVADALAATAADVHTLDVVYRPTPDRPDGSTWINHDCDLGSLAAINTVLGAVPDQIDVLLNCAGIPSGGRFDSQQIMAVNWLGLRHLTEAVLGRMGPGASVVHIASTAGRNWAERRQVHEHLMTVDDFDRAATWLADNPDIVDDGYILSKEAVQFYTMWRAAQLIERGIRMNSVCPGVTDTAIVDDFRNSIGDDVIDNAVAVAGRMGTPAEMASVVLFLADNSRSAYVTGVNLNVDGGTAAHRATVHEV